MKKTHKGIIAVVVIIAVVGGGYYYSTSIDPNVGDNITEWVEDSINISGLWKQEVLLRFEDGSTQLLSQVGLDPLTVEYGGEAVDDVTWYLQARAATPTGSEAWDSVRVDTFDELNSGTFYLNIGITNVLNVDIYPEDCVPLAYDHYIDVPVDNPILDEWETIFSHTLDFGTGTSGVFDEFDDFGQYAITFTPAGDMSYRGISTQGNGPWEVFTGTLDSSWFYIYYVAGDEWDSNVNWETGSDWTITP